MVRVRSKLLLIAAGLGLASGCAAPSDCRPSLLDRLRARCCGRQSDCCCEGGPIVGAPCVGPATPVGPPMFPEQAPPPGMVAPQNAVPPLMAPPQNQRIEPQPQAQVTPYSPTRSRPF